MASPQKENGYTAIANEVMEALAGIRINGEAWQCLNVILRKTYGWNKKKDQISLSQFNLVTKLGKTHIVRAIDKLAKMKLIVTQKGNENGNYYQFNKDYALWKPLPKKVMVAVPLPKKVIIVTQKGNLPLPKKGTTITTDNTKEITKSTREGPLKNSIDAVRKRLEDNGVMPRKK